MNEAKVMQVIYCNKATRGHGTESDPIRVITEILDFDGNLIMERDCEVKFTKKHLYDFATYIKRNGGDGVVQQSNDELLNGYLKSHQIEF